MRISDKNIDRIYINSAARSSDYRMVENHYHNYYELYYVRHGKARFYENGVPYTLESGDFKMVPPGHIHYISYVATCTRVNIYFRETDLIDGSRQFYPGICERFLRSLVIHVPKIYRTSIHSILDMMVSEESSDDASTPLMQKLLLRQLLLYFNRYCIIGTESDTEADAGKITDAVRYINENYSQPLTLAHLAELSGFSPTYFSKKFRSQTGTGMKEYITYVRLTHAVTELLSTDNTITEVALNSGFGDSNYFKDIFKKMYKMSPREYRRMMRGRSILIEDNKL